MLRRTLYLVVAVLAISCVFTDARKTSSGRSRSSSRGSTSRRTNYNTHAAAPTSYSHPSPGHSAAGAGASGAGGTSLFGWQTRSKDTHVQSSHAGSTFQSRPAQGQQHSYPNSPTGLSGNRPPSYEQSMKQSHSYPSQNSPGQHSYPSQNSAGQNTQKHSYPQSNTGLSGNAGTGNARSPYSGASAPAYSGGQGHAPVSGSYPGAAGAPPAYGNNYHQGAPPPYSAPGYSQPGYSNPAYGHAGYGHAPGYAAPGYGHAPGYGAPSYGGPGFGGYGGGNFGGYNYGMSRGTSTLSKVGIAGAGVGTLLTGLALYNLAKSGHRGNTYIYQDRHGNPVPVPVNTNNNNTTPANDPILGELVNCTLTISGNNTSEVIGIPCAIASSFSPNSDLTKGVDRGANTQEAKCTITLVTKNGTEFSTTVPCSIFLNSAKEANVTEPPPLPPIPENATNAEIRPDGPLPYGVNGSQYVNPPLPEGVNGSQYLNPPIGVPLAPFPNESPANQNYNGGFVPPPNLNPVPVGIPVGAPLPLPVCKPGMTSDPFNSCVSESQSQSMNAMPVDNAQSTAPAA